MSKSINLETITAEEYEQYVKPSEADHYHCRVELKSFDQAGNRISHPDLVKYDKHEFATVKHWLLIQGYTIDILHDPIKKQKAVAAANEDVAVDMNENAEEEAKEPATAKKPGRPSKSGK